MLAVAAVPAAAVGNLVAEPSGLDFGSMTAGAQRSAQLAFRNPGPDSVTLGDAWIVYDEEATAEPFTVDPGSCDAELVLPANGVCEMTATFVAPQTPGTYGAFVELQGDGTGAAVALLSGRSVAPRPPPPIRTLVAEPTTVGFPRTRLGSVSAARQVRVRNTSGGPVAVPVATVENSHFAVASNGCPPLLQAGAECVVSVVFKPTSGPPFPIGYGVGETRQRGTLLFGQPNPVTRRYELSVALTGDTSQRLDFASIKAKLATVAASAARVLRGGPRSAFLTAFTAPEEGSLTARVYGQVGKRGVLVAKGSEPFMERERSELPIASTRKGRRLLRRPQRTRVMVELTFRAADGVEVTGERTVMVRAPKAKKPSKRKRR